MSRHPTKGVMASRATRTTSILTTASQSRFTSKRSDITTSQSRKSVSVSESKLGDSRSGGGGHADIIVKDDEGNDVTPRRLFMPNASAGQKHVSQVFGSDQSTVGTPTDFMSATSLHQTGTTSAYAQPFSRSIFEATSNRSTKSKTMSSIDSNGEIVEGGPEITTGLDDVQTMRQEVKEILTEEDLNKIVDITLEETDTIWLYEQKQTAVSTESEEFSSIEKRNVTYRELVKSKEGNDKYIERAMQTFNDAFKHKDLQTDKINLIDAAVSVTNWDMYDTYQREAQNQPPVNASGRATETPGGDISRPMSTMSGTGSKAKLGSEEESITASRFTGSRASMVTASVVGEVEPDHPTGQRTKSVSSNETGTDPAAEAILNSEELRQHLVVMERAVTENIYQPRQALYRGLSVIVDPYKEESENAPASGTPDMLVTMGPTVDRLWAYSCSITKGRNVSSMAWNKVNSDILAVGYGQFGFNEQSKVKNGLACCWNLKNPEYPERVFHCKAGVTAVDFSSAMPNLLAVGLYDGTVSIYNVRSTNDSPVLDSFDCPGKHSSPVWQLCWIDRDRGVGEDKSEMLVSICADGRIVQWSLRKGFECSDLMKLKRTATKNQQKKKEKSEAFISRQAPGLCFDFQASDTNIYLAGTEEGAIHKCSCSYNEQYLDTYLGHTGPIYKISWSPFSPEVFLSSSADWSMRLWTQSALAPVLNFFSSTKAVYDICWSPYNSTVFCAANEGSIEIWDLAQNILDPVIVSPVSPGMKLSCVTFSKTSNSILVGDSDGQISVYQLRNLDTTSSQDALESIIQSTLSSQLQKNDNKS